MKIFGFDSNLHVEFVWAIFSTIQKKVSMACLESNIVHFNGEF